MNLMHQSLLLLSLFLVLILMLLSLDTHVMDLWWLPLLMLLHRVKQLFLSISWERLSYFADQVNKLRLVNKIIPFLKHLLDMKKFILPILFKVLSWPWNVSLNLNVKVTDSKGNLVFSSSLRKELEASTVDQLREQLKQLKPELTLGDILMLSKEELVESLISLLKK